MSRVPSALENQPPQREKPKGGVEEPIVRGAVTLIGPAAAPPETSTSLALGPGSAAAATLTAMKMLGWCPFSSTSLT